MVYPIKGKKSNPASFNYSVVHLYSSNMTVQLLTEIKEHRDIEQALKKNILPSKLNESV